MDATAPIDMTDKETRIVRAAMGIIGGIRTPKKAAASRANGAKGGRPSTGIGDRREIFRAELRKIGDLRAMSREEREAARTLARQRTDEIVRSLSLSRKHISCD